MSSTYLDLAFRASGREVFSTAEAPAAPSEEGRTLRAQRHNRQKTFSGSSEPPLDKPLVSQEITIGGGIATIDLAAITALALPSGATRTVDLTTAKLVALVLRADDENEAAVTVAPGASDPYPLFGAGNEIEIPPGMQIQAGYAGDVASGHPAVSATVKDIDISGTSGDVLYLDLYFGVPAA